MVIVYLLAAGVRVAYVQATRSDPITRDLARGTDMEVFDGIARDVLKGNWLAGSAADSPLYPCAFLPAVYALTMGNVHVAAMLQGAFGALLVPIVILLARRLYGWHTGILAGLIVALYAPLTIYDTTALGEVLLNVLSAASVLALILASDQPTLLRCVGAGLMIGLAAAAKPTTIPFAGLGILWLGWTLRPHRRTMARAAVVTILAATAAVVPFMIRTKLLEGRFFAVRGNSGIIFLMGNSPGATGGFGYPEGEFGDRYRRAIEGKSLADRDAVAYRMAFEFIRQQPGRALLLTFRKLGQFFSAREPGNNLSPKRQTQISFLRWPCFLGYGLVLPLAGVGIAVGGGRPRDRLLLAAYFTAHAAVIVAFVVLSRYRLIVIPALAVLAAQALAYMGRRLRRRAWSELGVAIAATLCLGAAANREQLTRTFLELRCRDGFRSVSDGRTILRDDSPHATPFSVTLSAPTKLARKTILLPEDDRERGSDFRLVMDATIQPETTWMLSVNGTPIPGPKPTLGERQLSVPIPKSKLRPGPNTFDIAVNGGLMRIGLDDRFDFDRSAVSHLGRWRADWLDPKTCLRYRSLWIANGELKVRLEFSAGL